ncbi:MAG: SRPBCC family protein [Gemmatimonadota bacterium]
MKTAGRILGVMALLLLMGLGVGLLLPGTWAVERSIVLHGTPQEIYPRLADPAGWPGWTVWPESARRIPAPERGVGAGWEWDDGTYGQGEFTLRRLEPPRAVEYTVEVEGGRIRIQGELRLEPLDEGTRLVWREEGDFGRNPLLGYQALRMEGDQGLQLQRSLDRLKEAVEAPR